MAEYFRDELMGTNRLNLRRLCRERGMDSKQCAQMDLDQMVDWLMNHQSVNPKLGPDSTPQEWIEHYETRLLERTMSEHGLSEDLAKKYLVLKERLRRVSPSVSLRPAKARGKFFAWIKTPDTGDLSELEVLLDVLLEIGGGLLQPPPLVYNNVRLEDSRAQIFGVVGVITEEFGTAGSKEIRDRLFTVPGGDILMNLTYLTRVGVLTRKIVKNRYLYKVAPEVEDAA